MIRKKKLNGIDDGPNSHPSHKQDSWQHWTDRSNNEGGGILDVDWEGKAIQDRIVDCCLPPNPRLVVVSLGLICSIFRFIRSWMSSCKQLPAANPIVKVIQDSCSLINRLVLWECVPLTTDKVSWLDILGQFILSSRCEL